MNFGRRFARAVDARSQEKHLRGQPSYASLRGMPYLPLRPPRRSGSPDSQGGTKVLP
jgi:hypothetical protein